MRRWLHPVSMFAAGGSAPGVVHTGFARADVVGVEPANRKDDITVALSPPWRPSPWRGDPIRFLLVFDPNDPGGGSRQPGHIPLRARLADGRTVRVEGR
jgi:hypothetical protein